MKRISFLRTMAAGLTMWLGLSAGVANAVTGITPFAGSATTGYNAIFGNTSVGNPFSDIFTFSIPVGASGNGGSNVISLSSSGNVIFSLFSLAEAGFGTVFGATGGTSSSLSFANGGVPGSYTLTVAGSKTSLASGSYAGNVTISPVPEPETYAMILAGLGLLGFAARRRKTNNFTGNFA